jgi:DNA-binding NarL/FixJ family response regulator
MKSLRVILADDHTLMRAGLRGLLEKLDGIEVIAEADDGPQALRLIEQHRPDLALLDISMPKLNGLEVTAQVTKRFPQTRVLILSMHSSEEYARQAIRAGAAGYLLKGAKPTELALAIQAITNGEMYFSPSVSRHLVSDYVRLAEAERSPLDRLTERQREVLQLMAEGNSRKLIAQKLNISTKTFDTLRLQLMKRLDIHDNAGLVRFSLEAGLVDPNR